MKNIAKASKGLSNFFFSYLLIPALAGLFIWMNPWIVFGLSVVSSVLIYFSFYAKKTFWTYYKWILFCCFLALTFIYSLSPRLGYLMFKAEHPNWTEVSGYINDYEVKWEYGYKKRNPKGKATVTFTGILNNNLYTFTKPDALYNYSFRLFDSESSIENNLETLTTDISSYIRSNNYAIFIKDDGSAGKIFIPNQWLLLSGSWGLNLVSGMGLWILIGAGLCYLCFLIAKLLSKKQFVK